MRRKPTGLASVLAILESGSRPKGGASTKSGEIPSLGGENILRSGGVTLNEVKKVPQKFYNLMTKGHLVDGDVLINKDGAQTGKIGLYRNQSGTPSCINEHLFLIRGDARKVTQEYLYYTLLSQPIQNQIDAQISGSAQPGLKSSFLHNVFAEIPTALSEQAKVAEILSTVDKVIQQTEALLAKQQRIKTGLMQDLLTRGIDEDCNLRSENTHEFKSSPLGRIPVEWEIGIGSDFFTLLAGMQVKRMHHSPDGDSLYLKVDDLNAPENWEGIVISENTFDCPTSLITKLMPPGTIVFPKRGEAIYLNRVALLCKRATLDPNLMGLCTKPGVTPQYFRLVLLYRNLGMVCDNSGIPQINNKHLYPLTFAIPSPNEQNRIVTHIQQSENLLHKYLQRIFKLRSLKTALMQDLLTGKISVAPLLTDPEASP